ncbi:MAG: arylamine N-acetyltransferase [Acidobacteria bacterium]|nr:arylamine N-acetyltransferase [Acidobacteriota bacterium]
MHHVVMRLDDYLQRIDEQRPQRADSEGLRRIHRAHRRTFLFDNLDIQTGRGVNLALEALERKFLDDGRGGYCFEHNSLFAAVLRGLGYDVRLLLGRVRRGPPEGWVRTHMLLRVAIEGELWIADVGFGALGLLEPMLLIEGTESEQGGITYVLRREEPYWVLAARDAAGTSDLYEFTEEPHTPADVEMSNHFTATYPSSIFRRTLTIQRATPEERTILRNELVTRIRGGMTTEEPIGAGGVRHAAREIFGVTLPEEPLLFER